MIGGLQVPLATVSNFNICLPLNELIILRLEVDDKQISVYITKHMRDQITKFLIKADIPDKRIGYDNYLQYGHNLSAFAVLAIFGIVNWLSYRIRYGWYI